LTAPTWKPAAWLRIGAVAFAALTLSACASMDRSVALTEDVVVPFAVGDATDVPADALAEAMLRAGFTPEAVLAHGVAVHHALATSGGAQVRQNDMVEAMFAIHAGQLYVTSRTRGTFIQQIGGERPA
jgi:hypothetical protein